MDLGGAIDAGISNGNQFAQFPVGTTIVTYTATDLASLTTTCSFTVEVSDEEAPEISCPANLAAQCDISEQPAATNAFQFQVQGGILTDNCGLDFNSFTSSDVSDGETCPETITRTYSISDLGGLTTSCTQLIVIYDTTAPEITCPVDVNQTADPGVCQAAVAIAAPITDDNCGVVSVINDYNNTSDASDTYPVGVTEVVWTVIDACGNAMVCTQTITITDDEDPVITCVADDSRDTDAGVCTS